MTDYNNRTELRTRNKEQVLKGMPYVIRSENRDLRPYALVSTTWMASDIRNFFCNWYVLGDNVPSFDIRLILKRSRKLNTQTWTTIENPVRNTEQNM